MARSRFKENFRETFGEKKSAVKDKIWQKKKDRIRLHTSFHRSYREDYERPLDIPGLVHHAMSTFQILFKNWKIFLPLVLLISVANVVLVGLMNEDTYVQFQKSMDSNANELLDGKLGTIARSGLLLVSTITTGGLSGTMTDVQQVFAVLLFAITWLVTIWLLRHLLAGQKVKMRDGLYNALTPLISSLAIIFVIFLQLIPIMIVIITYSAAVQTDFLSTPFYALVYFIFAALLSILSIYLISSSVVALVATSAPGLYPLTALHTASDLMAGRRIKFIVRLIFLAMVLVLLWVIVMLPLITLDLWLKTKLDFLVGLPFVSVELLLMTVFTAVYVTAYVYLYYRRMLDYEN